MYDVAIVGAGITGSALFRELTRYRLTTVLLERENDVALGASRANSAIVHAGYDPEPGSRMARLNVEGNALYESMAQELSVPFRRNGSLVLALAQEEIKTLETLLDRGKKNGVPGISILSRDETLRREPNLNPGLLAALYAPSGGIVGAYEMTIALAENAVANGGHVALGAEVVAITKDARGFFHLATADGRAFDARYVVNAAGAYADKIHNLIAEPAFVIKPRRGEYFLFDRSEGAQIAHTVFQTPGARGKGILVSPTVHGNLIVGPNAVDTDDPDDTATTRSGQDEVRRGALLSVPGLNFRANIRNFAGIRALSDQSDFMIAEAPDVPGFVDLAGIKSPGLTSAPAIAREAVEILREAGLALVVNDAFNPRREQTHVSQLTDDELNELIARDPAFGRIVCRCESVTEGEIREAIRRPLGARTVDGVKRRCRPGAGRCQGGFCLPRVVALLADELKRDEKDITLDRDGSWILAGRTKQ